MTCKKVEETPLSGGHRRRIPFSNPSMTQLSTQFPRVLSFFCPTSDTRSNPWVHQYPRTGMGKYRNEEIESKRFREGIFSFIKRKTRQALGKGICSNMNSWEQNQAGNSVTPVKGRKHRNGSAANGMPSDPSPLPTDKSRLFQRCMTAALLLPLAFSNRTGQGFTHWLRRGAAHPLDASDN